MCLTTIPQRISRVCRLLDLPGEAAELGLILSSQDPQLLRELIWGAKLTSEEVGTCWVGWGWVQLRRDWLFSPLPPTI